MVEGLGVSEISNMSKSMNRGDLPKAHTRNIIYYSMEAILARGITLEADRRPG